MKRKEKELELGLGRGREEGRKEDHKLMMKIRT